MDLADLHCFAQHDACLDDVRFGLRVEQRMGRDRKARTWAGRAVRQMEDLASALKVQAVQSIEEVLADVLRNDPHSVLMAAVKRANRRLNPIAEAILAARNAAEERRAVLHLLAAHVKRTAQLVAKSAFLLWAEAQSAWQAFCARLHLFHRTRTAHGFFGADKVDCRNNP